MTHAIPSGVQPSPDPVPQADAIALPPDAPATSVVARKPSVVSEPATPSTEHLDPRAQQWLDTQCAMMAGVSSAMVLSRDLQSQTSGSEQPIARWPRESINARPAVFNAAQEALRLQAFVIHNADQQGDADPTHCVVAAPLLQSEREIVVVALLLPAAVRRQQQALVQLLQWGANWYALLRRDTRAVVSKDRLVNVVEMLAGSLEHEDFDAAAATAVTELAARLSCSRVSLGLLRGPHVQVSAISNSSQIDTRSNLVRSIGSAMDEAIDQSATVAFPPRPDRLPHISFAQEALVRRNEGGAVCSTPLYDGARMIGALTLERDDGPQFDETTIETCEVFGALLGPIIELKHDRERWVGLKVVDAARDFTKRLFGRKHFALKAYALGLVALVALMAFATGDYRITAQATLEGSVRRVITAPLDGFVSTAHMRAGDIVQAGQLLATLDDRELLLERVKLESQREQYNKEHRAALTAHDRSAAAIVSARMAQATAQLALVDEQLTRTQLTAPFDGIIVSGDLNQSLGSPVENGQVLFEVAPLDAYRVILEVDERDIGVVTDTQQGALTLTGLPGDALPFTVTRIVPISTARDGRNFFEVEATLDGSPALVRPGMAGVGKIHIGERKLFWVWTHALTDWLRLSLWSWT